MPLQDEFIKRQYPRGTKRRVYIRRGIELQRFGYTDGCPGCVAAEGALKPAGHSDACRKRVEAEMLKVDVGERVQKAKQRRAKAARKERVHAAAPQASAPASTNFC